MLNLLFVCRPSLGSMLLLVLASSSFAQENSTSPSSKPSSPAEALAKFQLAETNLKIELAAAEPEVVDPVAIRFDEQGRMWVAEMRDYPLGPPAGEPPLSRIKILEDTDFDGRFEKATVFADKLSFVTGLQPWKGGVIVTLAGRIAWMKDSDGDGKMDVDETWYTGFAEQNSQLRANHPRLALDNHVYVANGLRGGVVVNKRLPDEKPINLQGRDFRFDPLTGKAEAISGNGQFGMCFDNWGNRFTCTNRNPVIHVVLEDRYLKMAPKIPVAAVVQDVAASAEQSKVYPISRAWTTSNLHAGTFTAACGVHVYRGDTLNKVLGDNSVFICDPTGNFVHLEKMKPDGPSFTSKPAYEGKEFLASPDEWFRPVNIETGPDGCLYIVDMYRCVIEHPDFVPDELKKRPDLRLGDDRGRIWRITNHAFGEPRKLPEFLDEERKKKRLEIYAEQAKRDYENRWKITVRGFETQRLLQPMTHANGWHRETLQRLLLEGDNPAMIKALQGQPNNPRYSKDPSFLVHALWTLHGANAVDSGTLVDYLESDHPQVRRQALLVAEHLLAEDKLKPRILSGYRVGNDPQLRFQVLLFDLARIDYLLDDRVTQQTVLADVSRQYDRWPEIAFLMRHHQHLLDVFRASAEGPADREHLERELARLIGSTGTDKDAMVVLKYCGRFPATKLILVIDELARGLQARGRKFEEILRGLQRIEGGDPLYFYVNYSAGILQDKEQTLENRTAAARVLGFLPNSTEQLNLLLSRASSEQAEVLPTLVASLAQRGEESKPDWSHLLANYQTQNLSIKRALVENSFRRADGPTLLLEQVKAGTIQPAEIDPLRRKTLLESKDAAIKKLAEELFAALNPANRQQALEDYQPVLKLTADAKKGAMVFEKNCSTCHRVGEIGVNVAPDISDTRTKTAAQLLADIIQPNRAIDSNFIGYQVLMKDGTTVTGLLSAETSTSLTLKQPGGKVLTVAREEIEALKATGVSLMPDGLEKNIPPEAMADLLAYLKNWRYLDGKTPLAP